MRPTARLAPLLLALALSLPAAAVASGPEEDPWKRRVCTGLGCVHTDDQDEDGRPDWANGAFSVQQLAYWNANLNRTNVSHGGGATTEEHEALHGPDDKALGVDAWGYANLTSRQGGPGFNDTELDVLVFWTDHETGEFEAVLERSFYAGDSDGDGRPDRFAPRLLP